VDTSSSFAYIGMGDGTSLTEQFAAYRPTDVSDATPIQPGGSMVLMSKRTSMYCRFAAITVTTPLSNTVRANKIRGLLQSGTCNSQGLICDVADVSGAAVMLYSGSGMSYNGVPLVQSPNTLTIIASGDPACSAPGGASFVFQLSAGGRPGCWAPLDARPCTACLLRPASGVRSSTRGRAPRPQSAPATQPAHPPPACRPRRHACQRPQGRQHL
jgi:hypothetical protein